ncbi:hypothetical protein ACIQBJ_18440 [Kitasatospora sp. NPDC088391]
MSGDHDDSRAAEVPQPAREPSPPRAVHAVSLAVLLVLVVTLLASGRPH